MLICVCLCHLHGHLGGRSVSERAPYHVLKESCAVFQHTAVFNVSDH